MLLKNQRANDEIFKESEKKNTSRQMNMNINKNQWDGAKGILRGKFVAYSRPSSTNKKNLK